MLLEGEWHEWWLRKEGEWSRVRLEWAWQSLTVVRPVVGWSEAGRAWQSEAGKSLSHDCWQFWQITWWQRKGILYPNGRKKRERNDGRVGFITVVKHCQSKSQYFAKASDGPDLKIYKQYMINQKRQKQMEAQQAFMKHHVAPCKHLVLPWPKVSHCSPFPIHWSP